MIETDLRESMDVDEIKRYMREFKHEPDYSLYQDGNMLIWDCDIYKMYRDCGYKSTDKYSNEKIRETYKRQVGYVARRITHFIILV